MPKKKQQKVSPKIIQTEVLIIGAGGAGLRAAIEATRNKAKVLIVSKEDMGEAHTNMAMGGLNVAMKLPATPDLHFQDTVNGGWHINNYKMADIFAHEMPDRIHDLESYGVKFDRLPDGTYFTWAGGKQSAPLNLCAGDYTGKEMMDGLVREIKKLKIPYLDNHFVTKLLTHNDSVIGAFLFDLRTGAYKVVQSKITIVATGGAGMLYLINTNAPTNTGEGYAWAFDLGAELVDMEMIQFHPTGMAWPPEKKGRLITEKVRGNGGILKNVLGERFMTHYQPKRLELAGRDEVTRAIYQEVAEGRGTEHGAVYLDVTHWEKGKVEKLIPDVFQDHMEVGIDIRKQMMEITPSMHHFMGGIKINEWGETTIDGMFAVGEVTRNVHGANRLGGNSLAEGQVFGRRAGILAAERALKRKSIKISKTVIKSELQRINSFLTRKDGADPTFLKKRLQTLMWEKVGIIREEYMLQDALAEIKELQKASLTIAAQNTQQLRDCLELQDMLKVAEIVTVGALTRRESRGAQYRSDFPERYPHFEKNIVIYKTAEGKVRTKFTEVEKFHFLPHVSTTYITGNLVLPDRILDGTLTIDHGKIISVDEGLPKTTRNIYDYRKDGIWILPGLIEVHGHMREPGLTNKGDILHETRAALAGGYTTIIDMPNTNPPTTTLALLKEKQEKLYPGRSFVDYNFFMGVGKNSLEELEKVDPSTVAGVKIFMAGHETTPTTVPDNTTLAKIFEILKRKGLIAAIHAEDQALVNYYTNKFKYETSPASWSKMRPKEVIVSAVARAIALAEIYQIPLYLLHLSTPEEFVLIDYGKKQGMSIFGELVGYQLSFTVDDYEELGNKIKVAPALRTKDDQSSMWQLLREGRIDVVCSEHTPHEWETKNQPDVWKAQAGTPGLQETLPALITGYVKKFGKETLGEFLQILSRTTATNPAKIFEFSSKGELSANKDADITIIDTNTAWNVKKEDLFSKSGWSAYEDKTLIGKPIATFLRGTKVYENGKVLGEPQGKVATKQSQNFSIMNNAFSLENLKKDYLQAVFQKSQLNTLLISKTPFALKHGELGRKTSHIYLNHRIPLFANKEYRNLFARILDTLIRETLGTTTYGLISVPSSGSLDITNSLAEITGEKVDRIVVVSEVLTQEEKGAHVPVYGTLSNNKHWLMIDDVFTSGKTMKNTLVTLQKSNYLPKSISAVSLVARNVDIIKPYENETKTIMTPFVSLDEILQYHWNNFSTIQKKLIKSERPALN